MAVHEMVDRQGNTYARKSFDPRTGSPQEREKLQKRFMREVRIQSQIRHPNIMPILDKDLSTSPPWFLMPMAERSFALKIEEDHFLGVVDPKPWQDILAAVEELHRLGYVHRDLKPANILLVNGSWVLADFGLILPTARDTTILTSSHSAYGSHFYAAPEQAQDFKNTPEQADIFALGCILHDHCDPSPRRVPYAQIQSSGRYAPVLEKCTEAQPRNRFPSIAALRAALFDLWKSHAQPAPSAAESNLLDAVLLEPGSADAWRALLGHLEQVDDTTQNPVLRSIGAAQILAISAVDPVLFSRLMSLLCSWASGTSFNWDYCDVVGDRLLEAYRVAPVRVRAQVVLAALELAVSHNRWHVMNQVGAMLGATADSGLIDRVLIEMNLDPTIARRLLGIEVTVIWARNKWHERLGRKLTELE